MAASQPMTIPEILSLKRFAVVGATRNEAKFGHKVYMALKRHGYEVYGVNVNGGDLDGDLLYPSLAELPAAPECVVMVVPPSATEAATAQALAMGVRVVWMQPGAEAADAVALAEASGATVIWGGPCVLVELAARDR